MRKGSRLSRLYSLAVLPKARGHNISPALLLKLEELTLREQRLFMRLEVAEDNLGVIKMYKKLGYRKFSIYRQYCATGAEPCVFKKLYNKPRWSVICASTHGISRPLDFPVVERLYLSLSRYLELKPRTELLNLRLQTKHDRYHMLTVEQNHKHLSFLESIVILLIATEIVLFFFK